MQNFLWTLIVLLPKNTFSQFFGWLASREWPIFSIVFRDVFNNIYKLNLEESEKSLNDFPSLQKMFVRTLKKGARTIADTSVVSPVDGKLVQYGELTDSNLEMIQAKGKTYNLKKLLQDDELAKEFEGGHWATIYLAPFNYHRIHSPITGEIVNSIYIPGHLWPVNDLSVNKVDELFCVNERIITHMRSESGAEYLVVKVGATNVGRITLSYTNILKSNTHSSLVPKETLKWQPEQLLNVNKGDELGVFELGSTVVLVGNKKALEESPELFKEFKDQAVVMGQSL